MTIRPLRVISAVAMLCVTGQAAPEPAGTVLLMVAARTLPDTANSAPGKGFTVTGLAAAADGTVWAANDGRLRQEDGSPYRPSLVHLSSDLRSVIGEVQLPFASSVQGLTIIGARLWLALPSEQAIVSVSLPSGGDLRMERRLAYRPNGLAYNRRKHMLLVGSEVARTISFYPMSSAIAERTLTMPDAPDQLLVTSRGLLISSGANRRPGLLILLQENGTVLRRWTLPQSLAIEGVLLRGDTMIVANDAWFHKAGVELNQLMRYRRPARLR